MSTSGNIQEVMVKQGEKNMRLLINHTHCHLRFMDFRVGNYDDKRDILDAAAEEHNLRKVFTLVEKQDSSSWRGAGFLREGVYPSFFRTADAYVMSRIYDDDGIPCTPSAPIPRTPVELETVDSLGKLDKIRTKMTERVPEVAAFMEELKVPLRLIPFGRTIHPDVVMRAWLRNKEGWACAEIDESFGHAVLAFTPHPESIPDMRLSVAAAEQLRAEQIRLEHGESTPFDVLQRERDLVDAESQKIGALRAYRVSQATLQREEGTILGDRNVVIEQVRRLD